MSAEFDLQSVERGALGTRFEGRVRHFASVDSTNELALIAARAGAKWGAWVADEQTAGRGRGGHAWYSAPGDGLYCSALVTPWIPLGHARDLPMAAGLAARAAVREAMGLELDLRWPNDLMFCDRKCGGILVESASEAAPEEWGEKFGPALKYAVVGIGLNVGHREFPAELRELATSLYLESGHEVQRETVLVPLLKYLDDEVKGIRRDFEGNDSQRSIYSRFEAASSWVKGKRVTVEEGGGYTGWTRGLNSQGFLQVEDEAGAMRTVLFGRRSDCVGRVGTMLLAIDVGNSNTVLGLYPANPAAPSGDGTTPAEVSHARYGSELVGHWRISTPESRTSDEFGMMLRSMFELGGGKMSDVTAIVISSVVPPLDSMLRHVCEYFFKVRPVFIEPGVKTGLPVLTDSPAEVGADRIVNCVAAFERFKTACIIVDMGTATTFDVVSPKGEFLGGAIAPGLGISADALFTRAARLPRIDVKKPGKVIGTGTVDNIQIGLYYGYIGLVDGILERMIERMILDHGPETRVATIATGGLAKLIAGGSKYIAIVDDNLTLTGLRLVYERHMERQEKHHRRRPV